MVNYHAHLATALAIVIAYLFGSLSSAVMACKLMRLPDPRKAGSGNPGTTNVLRIGGKIPALMTFAGDVLKAAIPVLIARAYGLSPIHLSCVLLAAFLGHLYPIFFQFRGGKGIATFFGGLVALCWPLGIAVLVTWFLVAFLFRISSLAALSATLLALLYNAWLGNLQYYPALILMLLLIYWRHEGNIRRLLSGHEPKIGKKGN